MDKVITLFQFYGHGDTMNVTWAPRLLKERVPGIKVNFACKKSHACFFDNNKYVDNVIIVDDTIAYKARAQVSPKLFENELNVWCGAGKSYNELLKSPTWYIPWESAKIINSKFSQELISEKDSLLPEFFYTSEEIRKANEFARINNPYIVIETECFSGQHNLKPTQIMQQVALVQNVKAKIFTSCFTQKLFPPFNSLNQYSLRDIGLIIERSFAFYGLSSGMTVASLERSLAEPKKRVVANQNTIWGINTKKYRELNNTIMINPNSYVQFIINDIKLIK